MAQSKIYSTKIPVAHLQTSQLILNSNEFTDSRIRQSITNANFRKPYSFIQSLNLDLLSTSSLDIL